MFKGNELKDYIILANKIETMTLSQDIFLFDQLIEDLNGFDPLGFETLNDLDVLKIDHRANQKTNPMVINFLEALKSKETLESFIKDLRQHDYTDAQVEDFKAYPLLNNEDFISARHKTQIIQMINFKTIDPARVETALLLERYQVENPIVAKLIQLKYESTLGYYNVFEYTHKKNKYIDSLDVSNDEALLHSIATCPLFDDIHLSKDVQKRVLFKLVNGMDYLKLSHNPYRTKLIQALDFNPITQKVFKAYLDKIPMTELIKSLEDQSFTSEEINEFAKSELFKIPVFYTKKEQQQLISTFTYGKNGKKIRHLSEYQNLFSTSENLVQLFLKKDVDHSECQKLIDKLQHMHDEKFLTKYRKNELQKVVTSFLNNGINQSNLKNLIKFNQSIMSKFIRTKDDLIQCNTLLYSKGFKYIHHETLVSYFEQTKKSLSEFDYLNQRIDQDDRRIYLNGNYDESGHTTTSPLTVNSEGSLFSSDNENTSSIDDYSASPGDNKHSLS